MTAGKWRRPASVARALSYASLALQRRALAMVLLLAAGAVAANPVVVATLSEPIRPMATSGPGDARAFPFFPAAGNARGWQGFMRVANHSDAGGKVFIRAIDDGGQDFGTVTLALDAGETVHFNSDDLEDGNAAKGISGRMGAPGQGDWRLELTSDLSIEAMAYVRTSDGFVTAMHDVAPSAEDDPNSYRVVFFNPGSNYRQESLLRLVNPGDAKAAVSIRGLDDQNRSAGPVRLEIEPRAARTVSALDLEEGAGGLDGTLGDGNGKWRLDVDSDVPLLAMSLLATPTGHITNLSTVSTTSLVSTQPPAPAPPAPEVTVNSSTEVEVTWVADLDAAGSTSWNVQLKYREDSQWSVSGCVSFTANSAGRRRLTAGIELRTDLQAGRVLQARYRARGEPRCSDSAASPGPWSEVGEAEVPPSGGGGSAGGAWGAYSVDLYASPNCPGIAAGVAFDHSTEAAAESAARRACRQDGGSAAECNEETSTFQGCVAMAYGEDSRTCGVYAVVSTSTNTVSLTALESRALSNCREDGNTSCRIWTNGSGVRISGCNAGAGSSTSASAKRASGIAPLSLSKVKKGASQ